jgi:phosphatidylglycerol:prolipoprotein diacylglycerol transferase
MTAYLLWWFAGGGVGVLCGLLVLRHRGVLAWNAVPVYLAAAFGCLYGAKLQYQLRFMPLLDALAMSPATLLEPGYHIPLGLACGLVAAIGACLVLRAPVLQLADALAMSGAMMMPVGRIGCLTAGCCLGVPCPTWLAFLCVIPPSAAPASLPSPAVHLLPVYYAALGAATAALYVYLLRRRARPGTLVAAGLLVYPLGHLAIEQLRDGSDERAAVMTPVVVAIVAADLFVLLVRAVVRRLHPHQRSSVTFAG